jgi:hypothetical protein
MKSKSSIALQSPKKTEIEKVFKSPPRILESDEEEIKPIKK